MSTYLSGGTGRAYTLDLENIVKCPSTTSSRTSHSSSPSSTLSESSNSPIAISTRKPRTPRKRPNQTYIEAAALLSTACPKVFSNNNLNLSKFTKQHGTTFFHEPSELLFKSSGVLLHHPILETPISLIEPKATNSCQNLEYQSNSRSQNLEFSSENLECQRNWNSNSNLGCQHTWNSNGNSNSVGMGDGFEEDFDTESILDEEIDEGIDSIMGNCNSTKEVEIDKSGANLGTCYGYPMGLGFGGNLEVNFAFGMRNGVRALKNVDEGNWWRFPAVNLVSVAAVASAPAKSKKAPVEKKKKRVEEVMKKAAESELGRGNSEAGEESLKPENGGRLFLKLNYEDVLSAWSEKGSPLPEEISGSESPGSDIHARLAQIDLFSENGGLREASVMRYKEKKRTRLFSKKIRYQVRKVNADRRPRSKGRFVRRQNSLASEDT